MLQGHNHFPQKKKVNKKRKVNVFKETSIVIKLSSSAGPTSVLEIKFFLFIQVRKNQMSLEHHSLLSQIVYLKNCLHFGVKKVG